MWHCEWQQFLFKHGNFQNLAKCTCYANYFIIVLRAKRKEQNSRQKKNSVGEVASWPMLGTGKQHNCIRQQPAEDIKTLFLPPICSTQKPVTITADVARGYVGQRISVKWWWIHWAGRLGGGPSTSLLLPIAPLPSQSQISWSKQAQYSRSLTPARAVLCTCPLLKKRGSQPWFLCALLGSLEQALTKPKWLQKHLKRTAAMSTHS